MRNADQAPVRRSPGRGTAAGAGLAMAFSLAPWAAEAEEAAKAADGGGTSPEASSDSLTLSEISVTGASSPGAAVSNTNNAQTGFSRLPGTVMETPATIQVVPQKIIRQQQATTLDQILKNVPGITLSAGEGNGGQSGSQFRIRGLSAKGDIYRDGLRDFGVYQRDAFDTDSVEVLKGPMGDIFGVGGAGGIINQSSKQAFIGTVNSIDQQIGSGPTYRTTVDSNLKINDKTAVRINGLYQNADTPDRNHVTADRVGASADLGYGIGQETELHLNYYFLQNDGVPDFGVPFAQGANGEYRPLTEYDIPGVSRSLSYVRSTDQDVSNTQIVSALFRKEFENGIVLNNDTRFGYYDRDFSGTNPAAVTYASLKKLQAGGNAALTYGAGGGMTYRQDGFGAQNVLSATGDFTTGFLRHSLTAGLDTSYQDDNRSLGTWTGRWNNQTVINPQYEYPDAYAVYGATTRYANATDVGIFANDRVWFNDKISLLGSLRWDYFRSDYETNVATVGGGTAIAREWSPGISAIWEPLQDTMLYASFSRSYKPIGTDVAAQVGGVAAEVAQDGRAYQPETIDSYEIGTKINLLDGRLGLTGSLFQINKYNAYTTDPVTGEVVVGFTDAGLGLRIRGFELGVTGQITEDWNVQAAYSYLNGEITSSSTAAVVGNTAPDVPRNNLSLWTAYQLPEIEQLPGRFSVGGGLQYASGYWSDNANTAWVPDTVSLDAMVGYNHDNFRVSLNAYNLTDHLNYTASFNNSRVVPAAGRTVMFNIGATF